MIIPDWDTIMINDDFVDPANVREWIKDEEGCFNDMTTAIKRDFKYFNNTYTKFMFEMAIVNNKTEYLSAYLKHKNVPDTLTIKEQIAYYYLLGEK